MSYNYWCENKSKNKECEFCNSKGDLVLEEKTNKSCFYNKKVKLKLMGENNFTITGKNKVRGAKEGLKRSREHFKKEIYPTLPPSERASFAKKHNLKK